MQKLSVNEVTKQSPIGEALDKGSVAIGNTERKVVKATRKTEQGKTLAK